jgi:putative nucleotidyltransferase with HDIG domain
MQLIDLNELVAKADELQPLPASATKLVSLINSGEADVDEITKIISLDPAMTVRLLRAANSAFAGSALVISTISEAISRLGTQRILSLAVASHARSMLRTEMTAYGLNEGDLWRHSVIPPASYTAALLHDIGKLVMARFLTEDILLLLEQARDEGNLPPLEAEARVLQVHHGELGGLIAQHWELPENIVKGITFHHNPDDGDDLICDTVHLANAVAKRVANESDTKLPTTDIKPDAVKRLGFDMKKFDELCDKTKTAFEKISALYGTG